MPKCKICKTKFTPKYFLQKACLDPACLAEWSKLDREQKQKKKDKARKLELKPAGDYAKEAQTSINKYVRIRDKNKPCISCLNKSVAVFGGYKGSCGWDAGHYRSRGSAAHLRFNLFNIHKQCVKCNRFKSGNAVDYRIELINRIGLERVTRLEQDNEPKKFTVEYLKRIKLIFNKKARLYEKKFR
jgi:hypothetical protein